MRLVLISLVFIPTIGFTQSKMTSEGEERTRISTKEKQNKVAQDIPKLLLQAWCAGEISAYYPKNQKIEMNYAQFLSHFGMEKKAYMVLDNQTPEWFCEEELMECIPIDPMTMKCMQYEIELGEENYFNQTTSRQEKKLNYIKLVYSSTCTARGIEIEGPVFKMNDIKKLDKKYTVQNLQNDVASLPIWSYLTIGNFSRTIIYKKDEFIDNPTRVSAEVLNIRNTKENENWSR